MKIINIIKSLFGINRDNVSTMKTAERLKVCVQCEHYNLANDMCVLKKAYMPKNATKSDNSCPEEKW